MFSSKECGLKLLNVYKDSKILSCYDDGDFYVFSIEPRTGNKVLDAFFKVNKKNGAIEEYPYLNDLNNFKELILAKEVSRSEYL